MTNLRDMDLAFSAAARAAHEKPTGRGGFARHGFSFAIMVVFFLVMMLALVAGAVIYRGVAASQARANDVRMESGLLTNLLRMGDMADAVTQAEGPEGPALVLVTTLPSGTYETRIYAYQGSIVQEYAIAGRPFNPENAVPIVESGTFAFSLHEGLVTITTDRGSFPMYFRSSQDGTGGGAGVGGAGSASASAATGATSAPTGEGGGR